MKRFLFMSISFAFFIFSFQIYAQEEDAAQKPGKHSDFLLKTSERVEVKPILKAAASRESFDQSKSVTLFLSLKNTTDFNVILWDVMPERTFDFILRDENDFPLPLSKQGVSRRYPDKIMGRDMIIVEPGKEFVFQKIDLSRLFDLTQPGDYTIEVSRNYILQDYTFGLFEKQRRVSTEPVNFRMGNN